MRRQSELYAYDWTETEYRCLMCNTIATAGHCKAGKHVIWPDWWVKTSLMDLEKQEYATHMQQLRA